MKVEDYVKEINEIRGQLADIGVDVDEKRLIHVVLGGLPSSWKNFITTFAMHIRRGLDISYAELNEYMQAEELQCNSSRARDDVALIATHQYHDQTKQYNNNNTPRPDTYNNRCGPNNNAPNRNTGDKRRPGKCNFCGKPGH